jgi:uncharacterized protein (DUF2235 family)
VSGSFSRLLFGLENSINIWVNRDTVDSVGILPKRLPFTTSNTIVHTFRHAVALDERRAKFKTNLWNRPTKNEVKLGKKTHVVPLEREGTYDDHPEDHKDMRHKIRSKSTGDIFIKTKLMMKKEDEHDRELSHLERVYSESSDHTTDIEEVWFAVGFSSPLLLVRVS